jgi:hypothetical protein
MYLPASDPIRPNARRCPLRVILGSRRGYEGRLLLPSTTSLPALPSLSSLRSLSSLPAPLPNLRHHCRRRQLLATGTNAMGLARMSNRPQS